MLRDNIISELYSAAVGRIDWGVPFSNLAQQMGLWAVQVIGVDKRSGGLIFSGEGGPPNPQASLDYIRFYHSINPRMLPTMATPSGEWMHCHRFFDEKYVAASPFYQSFLIPHGGRYLSATKILETRDFLFLLGIMRGFGSEPIGPADMPVLEQVRHHLSEAFQNVQHIRAAFLELGAARQLLNQFSHPMLLVDQDRRILHCNASATALLDCHDVVYEKNGFLLCRDPSNHARFAKVIDEQRITDDGSGVRRRVLALDRRGGSQVLAFVNNMNPHHTLGMFGQQPCVMIVFHDLSQSTTPIDAFILAECFDLTPAEAKVAVHIVLGFTIKEIAQQANIAVSTARTHLKRVMEKTGTTRQAELVGVVLTLPVGRISRSVLS